MGRVIEKGGEDDGFTWFDRIAVYLSENGISVPPIKSDNGHYYPAAIISAIYGINMTPPTFSKSCSVSEKGDAFGEYIELTVGGVVVGNNGRLGSPTGTFYIDYDGNITTS